MRKQIILILITMLLLLSSCNTQQKQEAEQQKQECTELKEQLEIEMEEQLQKLNTEELGCGVKESNGEYTLTYTTRNSEFICRPVFNEYIKNMKQYENLTCTK